TCELAELVVLDSGKLQQEFAKREARWERKHPDRVAEDDRREQAAYQEALDVAAGKVPAPVTHENVDDAPPPLAAAPDARPMAPDAATLSSAAVSEEVPEALGDQHPPIDMEADLRAQPAAIQIDLDQPL